MMPIQMQLCGLPILLLLLPEGRIVFQRTQDFKHIIDLPSEKDNISAIISNDNMLLGSTEVCYNTVTEYKTQPDVLRWLQQQKLVSPI